MITFVEWQHCFLLSRKSKPFGKKTKWSQLYLSISSNYWRGPRPILGGPRSLLSGTDIGETEGDLVAKGDKEGWKLGDKALCDSMSWATIGDWLERTGTNLLPVTKEKKK